MRSENEVRNRRKQLFDFMIIRKKEKHPDHLLLMPVIAQFDWMLGAEDDTKIMLDLYSEVDREIIK